jgi:hypothetical protein
MRERTTWNRDQITAAMSRTADPYAMNQDHLQQQPKADKYLTGDPSTFAEDITEPNTWDREYAGGTTERDEIGLPEFRGETFNHAEKTASMDEATLIKKADLCATVARMILKGRKFATEAAANEAIEAQSVALMYMPNADLIQTASRLAAEEDFPGGQFPHKDQSQQAGATAPVASPQEAAVAAVKQEEASYQQAVQTCMAAVKGTDQKAAAAAVQAMIAQGAKLAKVKKAAEEGQQQAQQGQGQQQQATQEGQPQQGQGQQQQQQATEEGQQAQQGQDQQQQAALEAMLAGATDQAVQAADYDSHKGPAINPPGYGPYNGPQAGGAKKEGKSANEQVQQAPQQGGQQQQQAQQQVQQEPQGQPQMQQADDQLLDDMLMGPQGGGQMSEVDIEMEPAAMDVGDVVLSATDDEVLKSLFANQETQDAEQAQQAQQGGQAQQGQKQAMTRTASTRTVGTRPSGGVSKIGGAPGPQASGGVDALSALWPSAPDVRDAFNMR